MRCSSPINLVYKLFYIFNAINTIYAFKNFNEIVDVFFVNDSYQGNYLVRSYNPLIFAISIISILHPANCINLKLFQPNVKTFFQKDGIIGESEENGIDPVAIAQKMTKEIFAEAKESGDGEGYITTQEAFIGFERRNPSATDDQIRAFKQFLDHSDNAGYISIDELIIYLIRLFNRYPNVNSFITKDQPGDDKKVKLQVKAEIKAQNIANKIFAEANTETISFLTFDEAIDGFKKQEKKARNEMIQDFIERVNESNFNYKEKITYKELVEYLLET